MKSLITFVALFAALAFAAPTFAGPSTGQPSHAQRIMKLVQHRETSVQPYALTGDKATVGKVNYKATSAIRGASRTHRVIVRTPAN
jgi:hypothetical protein